MCKCAHNNLVSIVTAAANNQIALVTPNAMAEHVILDVLCLLPSPPLTPNAMAEHVILDVLCLLVTGVDISVKDDKGDNVVHLAVASGQSECLRLFLEAGRFMDCVCGMCGCTRACIWMCVCVCVCGRW